MESYSQPPQQSNSSTPLSLRYNRQVQKSVPATRNLMRFSAENASVFKGSSNNVIRIPINAGQQFLDISKSQLCFDLTNKTGSSVSVQLDDNASALIYRFKVLGSDGRELERVDNFNVINTIHMQYNGNYHEDGVYSGAPKRPADFPSFQATSPGADSRDAVSGLHLLGIPAGALKSEGGIGYDQGQADILDDTMTKHYSFHPQASGWFNPDLRKLIPCDCAWVLELTLDMPDNCLVKPTLKADRTSANTGSVSSLDYQVENVYLECPAVTITDASFMQGMKSLQSSPMSWSGITHQSHVNSFTSGAGQGNVQISDRSRDLKSLITVLRVQDNFGNISKAMISKRSIQPVSSYSYTIGSTKFPQQDIQLSTDVSTEGDGGTASGARLTISSSVNGSKLNVSRCYAEVDRALSCLHPKELGKDTKIGEESFAQSAVNNGTGVIGCSLEAYSCDSTHGGIDTKTLAMPVTLDVVKTAAAKNNLQAMTFSFSGVVYTRQSDGSLTASY